MYISEFKIENFKSFENVKIHLNSKINVFTGVNNAGKSTVLEAISLWHECYQKLIRKVGKAQIAKGINKGDFVFGLDSGLSFSYTEIISVRSPSYEDIFYNLDRKKNVKIIATLTNDEATLYIGFVISGVDGAKYYKITLADYKIFDTKLLNDSYFIKNPETAIKVFYAAPLANVPPQEERQHALKIQYLKQSHVAYLAFRNRIEALYQRRNELGSPYDTFCNQLSTILLEDNGQVEFTFPQSDNLNLRLLIKLGAETAKDISLVGSGTLQIIEILLNIHEQKSELNIILLDEPDSHIHRRLQANLLSVLNASENTQIFITTHNESMIRDAQPDWIFHLEKQPIKTYAPITRDKSAKKGLLTTGRSPIIKALGGMGSGLDFVTALESDIIFMVEGINDALRIQKILSLKNNDRRKFAYWVMGNVDTIFDQLGHYKNVFSEIKNNKSLWDKMVLVFDKDFLTDIQREKLLAELKQKLQLNKVYAWKSYNFDSTLFSDLRHLTILLQKQIRAIAPEKDTSGIGEELNNAMTELVSEKQQKFKEIEPNIRGEIGKRQKKFDALNLKDIIEKEYHLQKAIERYLQSVDNIGEIHQIMEKEDCNQILKQVLKIYEIDFEMEGNRAVTLNLNSLFDQVNITTIYDDWIFVYKI